MKRVNALFLCLFVAVQAFSQNGIQVKQDSVKVRNSELVIENQTRNIPGVLHNAGNGRTVFKRLELENLGDTAIAITGHDTVRFIGGSGSGSAELPLLLSVLAQSSSQQQLRWWKAPQDFYTAPRIGVIGASQGKGSYTSVYDSSIIGRLDKYIKTVSPAATVVNYCEAGYNSRRLLPNGANSYVDVNRNITKALADGHKIIILVTPTNDADPNAAGGPTTLAENVSNIAVIEDACIRAGAALFVFDGFPRNDLSAASRQHLSDLGEVMRKKFGERCANVYRLVEDPAHPTQLNPVLQIGDNIHLNDRGAFIAFQPIRDVLVRYYSSNTSISKYVLQRTASLNDAFTDFLTVGAPDVNNNTYNLAPDAYFYRVRYFKYDGTYSSWSNIVQGTSAVSGNLPSVNAGTDQSIVLPATLTLSATASTPSGSITAYSWTKISGGAATITSASSATTTVTGLASGTYVFRCTVTNSGGLQAYDDVQVLVSGGSGGWPKVARFNFSYQSRPVTGFNNVIGYPHIAVLSVTDASGIGLNTIATTAWVPNVNESAKDDLTVTNDGGGFIVDQQALRNVAFTASHSAVDNIQITGLTAGKLAKILVTASAVSNPRVTKVTIDGQTKQYNATNNSSHAAVFDSIVVPAGGTINIAMYADAAGSPFGVVSAVVVEEIDPVPNVAPTVNAGNDQSVTLPATPTLTATASDSDGAIAGYSWTKISGGAATITSPNAASTTITGLAAGTYIFRCTVTDDDGATAYDEVQLVVTSSGNQSPTVNAGSDQSITLPATPTLTATASDPDGTIASYSWTKISGGSATITSANTASTTITGVAAGSYVFRCTVTDNNGATASDDVQLTVSSAANQLPTVNAGSDQSVALPATPTLTATASDADGTIVSYSWRTISGSIGKINSPASASTTVSGLSIGTYIFRCTVKDNNGDSAYDDIQFTVTSSTIAKVASFNFSGSVNSVPGFVNVSGYPHTAVRSGTSPSGIGVNTISTSVYIPNTSVTAVDNMPTPNDGNGYLVPLEVLRSTYFTVSSTATDNMQITGLTPGKHCRIVFMANAFSSPRITAVRVNGTVLTFNATGNSSKAAIFDNILVPAGGTINIAYYANDGSSYAGLASVLIVEEYVN